MTSHKIFYKRTHLLRNIRPLVALFTYSRETLVVPQDCHMPFIDNTIVHKCMCNNEELASQVYTGEFENNSKSLRPTVPCIKVSENM